MQDIEDVMMLQTAQPVVQYRSVQLLQAQPRSQDGEFCSLLYGSVYTYPPVDTHHSDSKGSG